VSATLLETPRERDDIHWPYLVPIATVHVLALLALVPYNFSWLGLGMMLAGIHLFGTLGINMCYHRLLTHRSFTVPRWLEHTFTTLAICCLEDTPVRWVATHRLHHNHSDEETDPHSPQQQFWWGHVGWLFRRNPSLRTLAFYQKYARDILSDPYYMYLEKNPASVVYIYFAQMAIFAVLGFLGGWMMGGLGAGYQLAASMVVWGVLVRTVVVWHITWSVNSLTHLFGYKTYATGENSRNNWLVAMLAAGEGWHNNHHHDPASASVQHRWWEIDLTFYVIRSLEAVGLASRVILPRHERQAERETERAA
jgi:fatty-acid desaturase